MAKFSIQKITGGGKTKKGTEYWEVIGTIDGELDSFKVWDQPQIGAEFEGELNVSEQFGKSVSTRGGGSRGGSYKRDPEIGNQIMRQNALEHAAQLVIKAGELTFEANEDKNAGLKEAFEKMKPTNVIRIADLFYHYSSGKLSLLSSDGILDINDVMTGKPITPKGNAAAPAATDQADDPTPAKGQDISPSDLPF